jgi:hypothetical protein
LYVLRAEAVACLGEREEGGGGQEQRDKELHFDVWDCCRVLLEVFGEKVKGL